MHENSESRREFRHFSYCQNEKALPRFVVVPAGIEFFHITEQATGRVRGFRRRHLDACLLARSLER
nr:hypothetical protein [Pseudomonas cremoricolorata]